MLENYSARRGVNIPVISFVTRKLISGHKDEFTRRIAKELGVKITAKSSNGHYVNIKGADESRVEAAQELITQLDQKAKIIADGNVLLTTGAIDKTSFALVGVHLDSLLENAKRSLPPLPIPGSTLESELAPEARDYNGLPKDNVTPKADIPASPRQPESDPEQGGEWKPKPRTLTIKFNSEYFVPRNLSQAVSYCAMKDDTISYVYAAGPMGGGKTYTPLRAAFEWYNEKRIDEILIIRPTSSTGKDPGAMPGDARRKQDPYIKGGIASNIEKMLVKTKLNDLEQKKVVRAFTPDFERGESYDHAFILVDEPQNLTMEQALLLVGRLGEGSIMVFAGDIGGNQNDLKGPPQISGLAHLLATQAPAALKDKELGAATAFIPFRHEDSKARNKILPNVSRALNEPTSEYAAILAEVTESKPNPRAAKAVEAGRQYAVEWLERAGLTTRFRYESQIQEVFPNIYEENRDLFKADRPGLKIA